MEHLDYNEKPDNTFEYQGTQYRLVCENRFVVARAKEELPALLTRVISHIDLPFDENNILLPRTKNSDSASDDNDMVSLSSAMEWQKLARMLYDNREFKVITIQTEKLIGPTFVKGSVVLKENEIFGLVPKQAIVEIKSYTWETAEDDYDDGEAEYDDAAARETYRKFVSNRARGKKPKEM